MWLIHELEMNGMLLKAEKLQHSYPHCWRHRHADHLSSDAAMVYFHGQADQGYRSQTKEAKPCANPATAAVEATAFYPSWGQARLEAMVKNRPDWCVSRQRNWGVPMALFVNKETHELHPRTADLLEQVAHASNKRVSKHGSALTQRNCSGMKRTITKNLPIRSTFGSIPARRTIRFSKPCFELCYPADLYLEGSDQHRGWFQSSLLTGCAIDGRAPYEALLTHGFVVDGQGHKMSKSKGNVIAPQKVMDTSGSGYSSSMGSLYRLFRGAVHFR